LGKGTFLDKEVSVVHRHSGRAAPLAVRRMATIVLLALVASLVESPP
jgi:hypothetical protein